MKYFSHNPDFFNAECEHCKRTLKIKMTKLGQYKNLLNPLPLLQTQNKINLINPLSPVLNLLQSKKLM